MKKLDDIPKKNVFKVPDGYFDELPTIIQSRMTKQPQQSYIVRITLALKYALPAAAIIVAAIIWFRPDVSIENELDAIDPNQIAFYLDDTYTSDIEHDEQDANWTTDELDSLENDVYSSMEYTVDEDILDDIDL